jgi:hypothetical protein
MSCIDTEDGDVCCVHTGQCSEPCSEVKLEHAGTCWRIFDNTPRAVLKPITYVVFHVWQLWPDMRFVATAFPGTIPVCILMAYCISK